MKPSHDADRLGPALVQLADISKRLGRTDIEQAFIRLKMKHDRKDWHLVVIGETSTGKSSLINSLVNENLLPESPEPTTGNIVLVDTSSVQRTLEDPEEDTHRRDADPSGYRFSAMRGDGGEVTLSQEEFNQASLGNGKWEFLRAEVPCDTALPDGVVIVDTPGYNSCIESHSQVLTDYLPNADAIIFLTNHRRGFTPADARFLKLALQSLESEDMDKLFFAMNFCPSSTPDAQVERTAKRIADVVGHGIRLHMIGFRQRERSTTQQEPDMSAGMRLDVEVSVGKTDRTVMNTGSGSPSLRKLETGSLWTEIREKVNSLHLDSEVERGIRHVAVGLVSMLEDNLRLHEEVANASTDELNRLILRMDELKGLKKRALGTVNHYREIMTQTAESFVLNGIVEARQTIEVEIDDANRFTDMSSCADYVRMHMVPNQIERLNLRIAREIEAIGSKLLDDLEDLALTAESIGSPQVNVMEPGPGYLMGTLRDQAVKTTASQAASWYLSKLGGAVGDKAGIVNLAKKVVSRGGKLFNKKFPVQVYNNMGKMLKQFGITAERAIGTFVTVIVDVLQYLYTVITWKRSLKAVVARALGLEAHYEPVLDQLRNSIPFFRDRQEPVLERLHQGYRKAIEECMVDTEKLVVLDHDERISTLATSLETRRTMGEQALGWARQLRDELEPMAAVLVEDAQSV